MISGKPVKSSMARTLRPASVSAVAVPPVDTISTPSSLSPRAKSTIPRLSETDSSARWMRTVPGAVGASGEVSEAMGPMVFGRCCARRSRASARPGARPAGMVLDHAGQQPRELPALGLRERGQQVVLGGLHPRVDALEGSTPLGREAHEVAAGVAGVALAVDQAVALEVGDDRVQ